MSGCAEKLLGYECERTVALPGPDCLRQSQPGGNLVRTAVPGDYESFTGPRRRKPFLTKKGNGAALQCFCDPSVGYGVDHTRRVAGV